LAIYSLPKKNDCSAPPFWTDPAFSRVVLLCSALAVSSLSRWLPRAFASERHKERYTDTSLLHRDEEEEEEEEEAVGRWQ
jgi:hypothetical protein